MKTKIKKLFILIFTCIFFSKSINAQQKENDYVLSSVTGQLDSRSDVVTLIDLMKNQNNVGVFNHLISIFNGPFRNQSPDVQNLLNGTLLNQNEFISSSAANGNDLSKDAAVILLYRTMDINPNALISKAKPGITYVPASSAVPATVDANGIISVPAKPAVPGVNAVDPQPLKRGDGLSVDFTSLNSTIYHKDYTNNWSNYLLATKKIIVILIDAGRNFYQMNEDKQENQLSNSHVIIKYRTSWFKQTGKDLKSVLPSIGVMSGTDASPMELKFTFFVMDPKRVKDPCDVVVQNKTFAKDQEFTVHEKNFASFQVGVANDKYRVNNFSISGGNLLVKPDDTQKEEWKSNLNALLEFHLPRDIDNFRPLWKVLFEKNPNKNARNIETWLYNMTFSRLGVYGGLKIAKDPFSNLKAGFNYALTKELYLNFGWTWANEVEPQVTQIGNITSLDDALKYAKRSYSTGKFSWGLSFAPSAVINMLGLGKEKEK